MKKINYILVILLFIVACNKQKYNNINTFIDHYDSYCFSEFTGYTIFIRDKTLFETVYVLSDYKFDTNNFYYVISKNNITNGIEILQWKNKHNKDISNKKAIDIIADYNDFNFPYLSVSNNGNFSINPFEINMKPYLLHLKKSINNETIKENSRIYKHYRGNWYLIQ
ncbi:hypothetical protein [Flavobacterium rhizosphaerae]|uniref:Lipoprotein n=1 Tax=Flavobacterium rhizosphaerae TaxID=3163298 RepID=A0ABW8YYZ9_9FLAO